MKNIKRISAFITTSILLLFLSSCNDTSDLFQITNPTAPVLAELDITMIELDQVNINNPAISMTWQEADYGVQSSVNYSIQFSNNDAFDSPVTAATLSGNNNIILSVNELNTAAGSAGLPPFQWNTLYARVVASIGTQNSAETISNTISFEVNPFFNYTFNDFYLVGDATAPSWNNNNNNPPLFRDPSNSNKYYYTGFFAAGQFKVLEVLGLWQPQWGTNDSAGMTIEVNDGSGSDPGTFPNNNSPIATADFYEFSIDFGTKTYTMETFDASGAIDFTSMSIQGSATPDGATPTPINQLAHDGHIWYSNGVRLVPGELQFITNTNSVWAGSTEFSGQATPDGGSIPVVVEDDYDIWFNDLTGRYILIPQNL